MSNVSSPSKLFCMNCYAWAIYTRQASNYVPRIHHHLLRATCCNYDMLVWACATNYLADNGSDIWTPRLKIERHY